MQILGREGKFGVERKEREQRTRNIIACEPAVGGGGKLLFKDRRGEGEGRAQRGQPSCCMFGRGF